MTKVRIKREQLGKFLPGEVLDVLEEREGGYKLRPSFFDESNSDAAWFHASRFDIVETKVSIEEAAVLVKGSVPMVHIKGRRADAIDVEGTATGRLPPEDPSARRDREHVPQPATFPRTPFAHFPDLAGWTTRRFNGDIDASDCGMTEGEL